MKQVERWKYQVIHLHVKGQLNCALCYNVIEASGFAVAILVGLFDIGDLWLGSFSSTLHKLV